MVKEKIYYECDICGRMYRDIFDAKKCESYGYEKPLVEIGTVVDYLKEGIEGWDSCDTYLPNRVVTDIRKDENNPHYLEYILGYKNDDGELVEDFHAIVNNNYEFEKYCLVKDGGKDV